MSTVALIFAAWTLIALVAGIVIGKVIAHADRAEHRRHLADVTFVRSARDYDDLATRLDREAQL